MAVGVKFTETMRGYMALDADLDYEEAELQGKRRNDRLELTVTITFPDIEAMLADPNHIGRIEGTVTAPALSVGPLIVEHGVFHLFERDPGHPNSYFMRYRMALRGTDGRRLTFHGVKTIRDDFGIDMWRDTTTLMVDLHDEGRAAIGRGIVRIAIHDFARQLTTIESTNASSRTEELWAVSRFGLFFEETLRQVYGGMIAPNAEVAKRLGPQRSNQWC